MYENAIREKIALYDNQKHENTINGGCERGIKKERRGRGRRRGENKEKEEGRKEERGWRKMTHGYVSNWANFL